MAVLASQTGAGAPNGSRRTVLSVEDGRALLAQRRSPRPRKRTALYELTLVQQIGLAKLPAPVLEFEGIPGRKFRFDLCWPYRMLALEIDGAVWVNGRHSRGSGVQKDCEKYSLAAVHGWRILRVTPDMVKSGKALRFVTLALTSVTVTTGAT